MGRDVFSMRQQDPKDPEDSQGGDIYPMGIPQIPGLQLRAPVYIIATDGTLQKMAGGVQKLIISYHPQTNMT